MTDVYIVSKAVNYKKGRLTQHSYYWEQIGAVFSTLERAQGACEDYAQHPLVWQSYNEEHGHVAEYPIVLLKGKRWHALRIYRVEVDMFAVNAESAL